MIKGCCGNECVECENRCSLDEKIPCSPDCENLTVEGKIKVYRCLKEDCTEIKYIFDMIGCSDEEVINKYGVIADYPYSI